MSMLRDRQNFHLTGATESALAHYERANHELRCFIGDPVASIEAAIADAPDFVMAHVFKGYLYGLSTERAAAMVARQCHAAVAAISATVREAHHVAALGHLANGRWHASGATLGALSSDHPLDVLALQTGHQIDFFTGNASMLRDRIDRALPFWSPTVDGHHALLAMAAFGHEEMGDYGRAETLGRNALSLEPRDGWAQHAVAHVMEMQSRQRDGIAWMRDNSDVWSKDSFFQVHNWWHLALFHYELGEIDAVLDLYDGPIYGERSTLALNMLDASALLWRLQLGGVDVGDRWAALADNWLPLARDGNYAFNDIHAMMAFVGAGRHDAARDLIEAQREAMAGQGDNAMFTRDVGHPVTLAIQAFGAARYDDAVRLLLPIPPIAHRFGGSHAQRDVIDLTLMEASLRADRFDVARDLASRRYAARPTSPLSALFVRRAQPPVALN